MSLGDSEQISDLGGGYRLIQSRDTFRFGTDSVLLSRFANARAADRVVDLGTGNGVIPVLLHQMFGVRDITAVEIQPKLCELAKRNMALNKLDSAVKVVQADLRALDGVLPKRRFDVVVCNPPYKKQGAGIQNSNQHLLIARHEVCCGLDDVVRAAEQLLVYGGRLCVVHKPERLVELISVMKKYDIEPKRIRLAAQTAGAAPCMVLAEGRYKGRPGLVIEPLAVIDDGHL